MSKELFKMGTSFSVAQTHKILCQNLDNFDFFDKSLFVKNS